MANKEKLKNLGLIVALSLLAAMFVVTLIQDSRITKLRIESKMYHKQQKELSLKADTLREEIAAKDKLIKQLRKDYEEIPKDNEVIIHNPITYVTLSDEWSVILKPIEQAVDSFSGRHSSVPYKRTSSSAE